MVRRRKKITNLKKRNRQESIFKALGVASISFALLFLLLLLVMIVNKSAPAFFRSEIAFEVDLSDQVTKKYSSSLSDQIGLIKSSNSDPQLKAIQTQEIDYRQIIKTTLKKKFPEVSELSQVNSLYQLLSKISNVELKKKIEKNPELLGKKTVLWFSASSKVDMFLKHQDRSTLNENQVVWIEQLQKENHIRQVFNWRFFYFADSREAEIAGIGAAFAGSFMVMFIFLILAFPLAIMCAFYLEEFAPKNRLTDIIEISINNLAAIPSIIYGLLGLTLYLQIMHLPRSSSLVGGMTLFMLALPVIIIATRNTIRSIPNSIRDAASALGASKMQVVLHHLLPLSIPGIMTGTILAVSRALGETAPLLMIGMVAFIADVPQSFGDPASALPVQIYLWSDSSELGFAEKTSAAILVLLGLLILFNLLAIILRKKFEKKW